MRGARPSRSPTLLAFVFCLLAVACSSGPPAQTSDIVATIPWQGDESLRYAVKNSRGDTLGSHVLTVDVQGATTVLGQDFRSATNTDETRVTADSSSLKPIAAEREIVTPNGTETIEVTYTEQGALIRQGERQSGLSVPEHAYDNDSSLFLWRTIPFTTGYEAAYTTIITNRRSRQTVELNVTMRETVRVPAGEFTAWRLEIKTSNASQTAWYADTPTRPLVRYDNDNGVIFELEMAP